MTEKVWTRETLTSQILKDAAGLWEHIDDRQEWPRGGRALLGVVKGGCMALLEGEARDTKDLLTLAVSMLHTIRELTLEAQERSETPVCDRCSRPLAYFAGPGPAHGFTCVVCDAPDP
jgi:hypothetical protein